MREESVGQHEFLKKAGDEGNVYVGGVDVGSLYTKAVILGVDHNEEHPKIISFHISRSGGIYKQAAEKAMEQALGSAHLERKELYHTVSTGYGRYQVSFGDREVSEISCHAYGIKFLFPEVHTLIDIGGQDSRIITLDESGGVANFAMNDKCAAGTGRFLEVMAGPLDYDLVEMGEVSLNAKKEVNITSTCTVFAETEVISLLSEGYEKIDITAGIYRAIANRMAGLLAFVGGLKQKVAMSGGVAKSRGMVKALEKRLRTTILVSDEPQIMGALGAALFAAADLKESVDIKRT